MRRDELVVGQRVRVVLGPWTRYGRVVMIRDDSPDDILVACETPDTTTIRTAWYPAGRLLPAALDRRDGSPTTRGES